MPIADRQPDRSARIWHLMEDKSWADLTRFGAAGETITLTGARHSMATAQPFADACVEIWQSDPPASDRFPGFGRCDTDSDGNYRFLTLKPGPMPGRGNAQQAPHFALCILARGLMHGLVTRAYFAGRDANETDPAADVDRGTGAARDADRAARGRQRPGGMDIRLQGDGETVFLDI